MWQTVDYKGNTVKWYEAELIEKISDECCELVQQYLNNDYEEDCDKYIKGAVYVAQHILDLIQENET